MIWRPGCSAASLPSAAFDIWQNLADRGRDLLGLCCRQKAALQRDSSRDEDALNAYLFELIKAGRVSAAAETCVECGQPWRAASLLGGGPFGPIPLGEPLIFYIACLQQLSGNIVEMEVNKGCWASAFAKHVLAVLIWAVIISRIHP